MNINFVGAVGGRNFGDEFILNTCINEYLKIQNVNIFISGFDENILLRNSNININNQIDFFKILFELRKKNSGEKIVINDLNLIFNKFDNTDIIHFIGGGYINSLWQFNYALLIIAYIYAKLKDIPIYGTGLGLYPYIDDYDLISLFESLSFIDVRDKESQNLILNSSFTGDDALLSYKYLEQLTILDKVPSLIISLQSHLFNGSNLINKIFTEKNYSILINNGIKKIIIIEAAPEDNIKFSREIYKNAYSRGIIIQFYTSYDLINYGFPFNPKSIVITSRYHINLIYSMLGLSGFSVYENEYYKNKHLSILDMGGSFDVLEYKELIFILEKKFPLIFNKVYKPNNIKNMAINKDNIFSEVIRNKYKYNAKKLSIEKSLEMLNKYIGK